MEYMRSLLVALIVKNRFHAQKILHEISLIVIFVPINRPETERKGQRIFVSYEGVLIEDNYVTILQ